MFSGIAHVAYSVTDMEKAIDFYCNKLGLVHAFSLDHDGKPWIEYLKLCDGQFIELFYLDPDKKNPGTQYSHLCLMCDDIHAVDAKLRANGVNVTSGPNQGSDKNWQLWIADPDGNRIEVMQIDPSSPQANS